MRQVSAMRLSARLCALSLMLAGTIILSACSGGGGGGTSTKSTAATLNSSSSSVLSSLSSSLPSSSSVSSSQSLSSSSFSSSSVIDTVKLSGIITYDYVPHNVNHVGLNYSAIEQRPVRGAVLELINNAGQIKASTVTTEDGSFSVSIQKNIMVKVRVKAQLLNSAPPTWNFKVTDNTANNALYVLDGNLASTGSTDSVRILNAASGWDGTGYTGTRSAAPFAILDNMHIGITRLTAAGNTQNLSPLDLRWSTKNSTAEGDYTNGEIGTSFYDGSAIYILGDANNDIDEYDPHVLLHEWGHYLEKEVFRSDSIGGDHPDGQFLDIRVAMSEGFANAFSGMMINDASYADASDSAQSSGFTFNIGGKNRTHKGYFSEGSIGSILYNFYSSSANKIAHDFTPIFKVLSNASYYANDAMTSIYLFSAQLKNLFPEYSASLEALMQEQIIFGVDEYGTGESNNGGLAIQLPIYKKVDSNNIPVNVCSDAEYGEQNKLGDAQFIKLNINQAGTYNISMIKAGGDQVASLPGFSLYQKGRAIEYTPSATNDFVSGDLSLPQGNYVLEIYDLNNQDNENTSAKNMTCFDVRVTAN